MQTTFEIIDGIKCYAPKAAFENADYPTGHFDLLFNLEANNFWFKSRNRVLTYLFSKHLGNKGKAKVLEIGCGTGFVLKGLSKFDNYKLYGAELHLEGLKFAKKRLPNAEFLQLDFRYTPFEDEFDAVGAFDVLEHIEEDFEVMQSAYKALKNKGLFFISVPQHKWLWSTQDETAYHKRRYSKEEMIRKLQKANFKILFVSSFVFTLLPLMFLSRLRRKKKLIDVEVKYSYDELILSSFLNKVLNMIMYIDEVLIKLGLVLPCGGSLLVVARKGG